MENSREWELLQRTQSISCSHDPVCKGLRGSSASVIAFSETFPFTPQDFFYRFFSDEKDYFTRYHKGLEGYSDLQPSEWQLSEEGCCLTRLIRFRIQVYNPIGLDSSMVSQVQRCKLVGSEVVYSTRTTIHDIPYGSSFVSDAFWRLSPSQIRAAGCDIQINGYLTWTGGSLVKDFVSKLALEGVFSYHSDWLASAKGDINEEGKGIGVDEPSEHSFTSSSRIAKQPSTRKVIQKKFRSELIKNSAAILVKTLVAICLCVCVFLLLLELASTSSVRRLINDQKARHSKLQQEMQFLYTYLSDHSLVTMDRISEWKSLWTQDQGLFESLRQLKEKALVLQDKHSLIQRDIDRAAARLRQDL